MPIRYALTPGSEEPEAPRLSLVQNRLDLRGEIETGGGFLDRIRLRAGAAQYRHYELEEDGGIGTAFYNKGIESRLELVQSKRNGWQGASGVQFFNRDFDVRGDEAFLPRNNTAQVGLFTLQQLDRGAFKMEAGARYEHTSLTARTAVSDDRFFRGSAASTPFPARSAPAMASRPTGAQA